MAKAAIKTQPKSQAKSKNSKSNTTKTSHAPKTNSADVEIQYIPLNLLEISPSNVRKVKPSENDDKELLASIKENGLKQNLAGHIDENGRYLIDAGGRRLNALQQLAEQGHIRKDYSVPCLIVDESEAILTSTTENTHRTAMHPADQYVAFSQLIDEGRTEEEISLKFGISVDVVKRRLKLARVAPEIMDEFRENNIALECVMAFTLTEDHDRQTAVWNLLKDSYNVHPHYIRRHLTETSYSANSPLGRFVGVEAYEAEGGSVIRDLFSDQNSMFFENPELVEKLAIEKLQTSAASFVGDWKWVDVHLEIDHSTFRSFGRVYPEDTAPDPDLATEMENLNIKRQEIQEAADEDEWTEEVEAEYDRCTSRIDEIETEIEQARTFRDQDREIAGIVLTVDRQGNLMVEKGLVRPEDIPVKTGAENETDLEGPSVKSPQSSAPVPVSDPAAALRKAEGISQALADDLRTARHHILRAHLAADYEVAYDAMLYTLARQVFDKYSMREILEINIRPYRASNMNDLVDGSVADRMLIALKNDLVLDWLELEAPHDLRALSALPREDKEALFAWVTAHALNAQLSNDQYANQAIEEIGTRLDVDVAACWRPDASNYWRRVSKAHASKIATDLIGTEFAEDRNRERKGDMAVSMAKAFTEFAAETEGFDAQTFSKTIGWLPVGMAIVEPNTDGADDQGQDGDANIPEILKDAAA